MRKKLVVISIALMVSVMVVFLVAWRTNQPAEAVPAVAQDANVRVCLPPRQPILCGDVPLPTVTLPQVTVRVTVRATIRVPETIRVTLPPVRLPAVTVTRLLEIPGEDTTVTLPPRIITGATQTVPGPIRTVTAPGLPRATNTVIVSQRVIQNGTAPPVTQEVRRTVSAPPATGQTVSTSVTVTPSKEVVRLPGTTRTISVPTVVGLSLLGLLALMGLGLFLLWLGFILGYRSADKENTNFLKALRDTVKRTPGKHE